MPPAGNSADVLILGGGASGLAAACALRQRGLVALVLEKEGRVGRKLLATGNGRCNLLNTGPPRYFGGAAFALEALRRCPKEEIARFFDGLGLILREEGEGRVYPATGQAASVLDVLRFGAGEEEARLRTGDAVTGIRPLPDGFEVVTQQGARYRAPCVIAAGGGLSAPATENNAMHPLLSALGHRVIPPTPALTPLETEREGVRGLKGLRLPAFCSLWDGEEVLASTRGELLFTDYGLSGICAMQLSRRAGEALGKGRSPRVVLDFSPLLLPGRPDTGDGPGDAARRRDAIEGLLRRRAERLPPGRLLTGALPRLLAERLAGLSLPALAERLSAWPLRVTGVRGFAQAQVTAGGVDTGEADPRSMASRKVPGLFLAGELLDVDGDCGGFNLQFAWASGLLAAGGAAAYLGRRPGRRGGQGVQRRD